MRENKTRTLALCGLLILGAATGCSKAEYLGNTSKGFWSEQYAQVSPHDAYREALPFLEPTWERRCELVRHHDAWCDKPAIDHMVRSGEYYYVTRTSYTYDNPNAYTQYAVRVHVQTGEVVPLK
jgi:hypothetical protein